VLSVSDDEAADGELPDAGAELDACDVELALCELPPHAASKNDAATAPGMSNFLSEITVALLYRSWWDPAL
jgi:hypothetical protein